MKKILILASLIAGLSAYAQSPQVNFNTKVGTAINAPIYQVDGSSKIDGAAGWAQLFVGATATDLKAVGNPVNFRSGAAASYIAGGVVDLTGVAFGSTVQVQLRAWNAAGGNAWLSTWPTSADKDGIQAGMSATFQLKLPAASDPPPLPANLDGLTGFSLAAVPSGVIPEPSTIALALLGAGALLIRRRQ